MSLRSVYMYAKPQQQQPASASQGIFERAVQDPFGWSGEGSPPPYGGLNYYNKSDSFSGFDRWGMGGNKDSSSSVSSMKDSCGESKSSPSPARSNSIPTHLFGVERYVSSGLDELSSRNSEPLRKDRKKSFIEMSLARSFSRDE